MVTTLVIADEVASNLTEQLFLTRPSLHTQLGTLCVLGKPRIVASLHGV